MVNERVMLMKYDVKTRKLVDAGIRGKVLDTKDSGVEVAVDNPHAEFYKHQLSSFRFDSETGTQRKTVHWMIGHVRPLSELELLAEAL